MLWLPGFVLDLNILEVKIAENDQIFDMKHMGLDVK
jgi:hypothetical protein